MDISLHPDVVHHAAPVAKHAAHVAAKCVPQIKEVIKEVPVGVSMMYAVISSALSAIVAGGLAWYIRGRGMTGVQIDINNAKAEIEKLKAQLTPAASNPAPTVVS